MAGVGRQFCGDAGGVGGGVAAVCGGGVKFRKKLLNFLGGGSEARPQEIEYAGDDHCEVHMNNLKMMR